MNLKESKQSNYLVGIYLDKLENEIKTALTNKNDTIGQRNQMRLITIKSGTKMAQDQAM